MKHMSIKLEGLSYKYPLGDSILEDSSFDIEEGEFIILLGKNGTGKSTLLRLLVGLRTPCSGSVSVLGLEPQREHDKLVKKISYLSQSTLLPKDLSVQEYLDFMSIFSEEFSWDYANELIDKFEIDKNQFIGSMSLGESNRATIVAGLARNTDLIIVDEMTAVLDPLGRNILHSELKRLNTESKKTIILATNIPEDVKQYSHKVVFIKNKSINVVKPEDFLKLYDE